MNILQTIENISKHYLSSTYLFVYFGRDLLYNRVIAVYSFWKMFYLIHLQKWMEEETL